LILTAASIYIPCEFTSFHITGDTACIVNFLIEEGRSRVFRSGYLNPIIAGLVDQINPCLLGLRTSGDKTMSIIFLLISLFAFVLLTIGLLAYVLRNPIE
jgi:hypothetical protein